MTGLRVWLARIAGQLRVRRRDRDLDDEIAAHLAEAAEEFISRGLTPDEARLAALRSFGGVARTAEAHREARTLVWCEDFRQDLRFTFRRFAKTPGFALVAIVTLALGIGANTTIFTLLDAVVFKPLPVPQASELVTFYENGPEGAADVSGGTGRYFQFSYPRFARLQRAIGSSGSLAAVTRSARFVVRRQGDADPHFAAAQLASGEFFSTLGVSAQRGRLLAPDDVRMEQTAPVAVISDGFWKRMFGGADDAIGQTLVVNGVTVAVVGVAPPRFVGLWTDLEADIWLPVTLQLALRYVSNSSSYGRSFFDRSWLEQDLVAWLNLVGRVPMAERARAIPALQAANRDGLAELVNTFDKAKERSSMLAHSLVVEPASRGFSLLRAQYSEALFALGALVLLVLLVTCANIANLLLARAAGDVRDIGIRISLGAGTSRLVRQCLTESLVLALCGGVLGVLIAETASGFLAREVLGGSAQLPLVFAPDRRVLAFSAAVSLATAIVFGLAPALRAIALARRAAIVTQQRQLVGHVTMSGMRALVAGQLALSVVIVFAAMLLGRTLINFTRIDPGFSSNNLVTVSFDPISSLYPSDRMPELARRLVAAVREVPGVVSAAAGRCGLIAGCSSSSGYVVENAGPRASLYNNWVGPGYFRTVGIPLVTGREFDERDAAQSPKVAVINETIATRFFPGQNPVGHRLGPSELDTEIVGVARDARTQTLHDLPVPMVYFPVDQKPVTRATGLTNLDVRIAGNADAAVPAIRAAVRRAEPQLLIGDVGVMSDRLDRDLMRERLVAYLAFSFGSLTLLLASLGLYGVLSYGVARRTQEIGVRLALGAQRRQVMGFVLAQSARLTAIGLAIGLAATAAVARYLSGMLFGVAPLEPTSFVIVSAAFVSVTMVTAFLPARRATNVDPIVALRCE
jgi:putative ABC transport system permease protein